MTADCTLIRWDPRHPPFLISLEPETHRCFDGGASVHDVRHAGHELITVSNRAFVGVNGSNFAPLPNLMCMFKRQGESAREAYEHTVPARACATEY
jgi:hypothetical protein